LRHALPLGTLTWQGERVDLAAIRDTAMLTVEGELDDICAPGQTVAAHDLCTSLTAAQRDHLLQPGVGHYGIFNGRRWREAIVPHISRFIRLHGRARSTAGFAFGEPVAFAAAPQAALRVRP